MSKFLIYKASAGSGKTYTLVKEYLKIVLKNPEEFRHILAITFTNKAADEMKDRVVKSLIKLSNGEDKELEKTLISEGVTTDIKQNSLIVLKNILHKYFYFSILTIDSFFQRVIRSFSKELNLHIGYTLEMDTDMVIEKITDELLDDIGEDEQLTEFLEDFVYKNIDESKDWKIENQIKNIGMEIFRERFWELKQQFEEDVLDKVKVKEIIDKIREIVFSFENEMTQLSRKANDICENNGLEISDFTRGTISYLINHIGLNKKYEPGINVYKAYNDKSAWYPKSSKKKDKIVKALDSGLDSLLHEAIDLWESEGERYNTAKALFKTIHVIGIFKDLLNKLKKYRDENKLMLISDANNIIQQITSDMAGAPFVYEKIGNHYKYFLIDEFQDTSTFQWTNLLPLIENSLSEGNLSMVVGDVKQSIYRWRNGNMRLLLDKINKHLKLFEDVIEEKTLEENRRSRKNIVEFNNKLFSGAPSFIEDNILKSKNELLENAYNESTQRPGKDKPGGYINIKYIHYDKNSEVKPYEIATLEVISIVKQLSDEKIPLKDILILTRKNDEASDLAKTLGENNIPVVSSDSLYLSNSPKVKLLVNLLKYIVDNKNILAKSEALYNCTLITCSVNEFDKIFFSNESQSKRSELSRSIEDESLFNKIIPADFFWKNESNGGVDYSKINSSLNNLSLYELIESLIRIFSLSDKPDSYLMRFMDIVLEYAAKYTGDLTGFLSWWDENWTKYSIIVPEEADALRIMTIHKAKGLQSRVVIVPYLRWQMGMKDTYMWAATDEEPFDETPFLIKASKATKRTFFAHDYKEEEELTCIDNLNLLYVAFTRPIDRLYAVVAEPGNKTMTAGVMLRSIIINNDDLKKNYNLEKNVFELGSKVIYKSDRKSEQKTIALKKYISNDLYRRITIRQKHESLKLLKDKDFSDKTSWGNLVHKALSYINKPEEVNIAIERMKQEGLITGSETEYLNDKIAQILLLDEVKRWFVTDYDVKTEKNILQPDGETIRPDRVLVKNNKAIVIDYKTGIEKEEHAAQINKYANALMNMGYSSIEKYLFYVEVPLVKQIL